MTMRVSVRAGREEGGLYEKFKLQFSSEIETRHYFPVSEAITI